MADILEFPQQSDDEEYSNDGGGSEYESPRQLSRRTIMRQASIVQRRIKKAEEEYKHWDEEARSHEQKKNTCMVLLVVTIGNDAATIFANLVSFGLLGLLTAPVPGILRAIVATTEREVKPERLLRAVLVMGLKMIPAINMLPSTTFLMVVDLVEANTDLEMAKNKKEAKEKEVKQLKNKHRQIATMMRSISQRAA